MAAALALAAGCQPQNRLRLKYYPEQSSGDIFEPSGVAVTPVGDPSVIHLVVGTLFDSDGNQSTLIVDDPPNAICRLVTEGLKYKGLKAKVFATPAQVPDGYDYIVACSPAQLSIVKRVDQAESAAENSFIMEAKARLQCALVGRNGKIFLNSSFSSVRDEPPLGEAAQHHRRIITEPSAALSAAISKALDDFTNNIDFRKALPAKIAASDMPATAPRATASPTPSP